MLGVYDRFLLSNLAGYGVEASDQLLSHIHKWSVELGAAIMLETPRFMRLDVVSTYLEFA